MSINRRATNPIDNEISRKVLNCLSASNQRGESFEIFNVFNRTYKDNVENEISGIKGRVKFFLWRKFKVGKIGYTNRLKNRLK